MNEGGANGEPAAHRLGDGNLELSLGAARLGPVRLENLAAMLDFQERAAFVVARAPEHRELAARLDRPRRARDHVRHLDVQVHRRRLQHLKLRLARDGLVELVLGFDHDAEDAGGELRAHVGLALAVGREVGAEGDFAEFPRHRLTGVGLRFLVLDLEAVVEAAVVRGAGDLRRLLEVVHLQRTLRFLAETIERGGTHGELHVLVVGLPFGGGCAHLESRVADLDGLGADAGFARHVGHFCGDGVLEDRLVLLGNRGIGLGRERHEERAVGLTGDDAMGDLLGRLLGHGSPPVIRAEPIRVANLAGHAVLHFRAADGHAGIGGRLAGHLHLGVQLRRFDGRLHLHTELRPLVLLDRNLRGT